MSDLLARLLTFQRGVIRDPTVDRMLAFDRVNSVREIDQDGRLHVKIAHISKANVCPYKGSEIPNWQALGLEPDRIYKMYRAPEELGHPDSVASANNIQLMSKHVAVTAADPKEEHVAGSTGTDAEFVGPYLDNSLVIWRQEDIDDVESRDRCELSCAYHYEPDMTSGISDGEAYDGVMRRIRFNHVALVEEGRAGHDVVVADSRETLMNVTALATRAMSIGAVVGFLQPRLAKDAKVSVAMAFDGIPVGKKFDSKLLAKQLTKQVKGKLANDASMGQIAELLDMIDSHEGAVEADESVSKEQHGAMEAAAHGQSNLGIPKKVGEEFSEADKGKSFDRKAARDWLSGKGMSEDDIAEFEGATGAGAEDEEEDDPENEPDVDPNKPAAKDEPPPFEGRPDPGGKMAAKDKKAKDKAAKDKAAKDAAEKEKEGMVSKGAMDAAIEKAKTDTAAAVLKSQRELQEALREVRPIVGEIHLALDSAEAVYKHVLEARKVDIDGVPASAYRAMVKMIPRESTPRPAPAVAMDAAASTDFAKQFPGAAAIQVMGG